MEKSNINIVVLAEETQYKVNIKNKIENDDNIAIVGYAEPTVESLLKVKGLFPDIVVVAVDGSSVNEELYTYIEDANFQSFRTGVVLVTNKVNINVVNDCARVGIRQVISIDDDEESFCETLHKVSAAEQRLMGNLKIEKRIRSRVYSFMGSKGGVGTSTIVTNVVNQLASSGKNVFVIDLDLQFGDLGMLFSIDPRDTIVEIARDIEGISIEKINNYSTIHSSGATVLCAPKSPEFAEYVSPEQVAKIIENIRPYYEYIVIDIGTNFSDNAITALENSDEIFLVNTLDILSLRGAKAAKNILSSLGCFERTNLLLNMCSNGLIKIKDFENMLEKTSYATLSFDHRVCQTSVNSGMPYVKGMSRSAIAKDTVKLTNKIIEDKK